MPVTLAATAVPVPKTWTGIHDPAASGPITTTAVTQGGSISASGTNERSGRADLLGRYGGGAYGIVTGLALSTASGLTLDISAGHAMCDGVVARTATSVVLTDNQSRIYLYLSSSGSITAVNASLTPPAGAQVFLGSCVTNSPTGSITGIDQSGVMYLSPFPWRATSDAGPAAPGDSASLPTTIMFLHRGANNTWLWDGPAGVYKHLSAGATGTLPVASGGTGATTAEGARTNLGVNSILLFASTATATLANTTDEGSLIGAGTGSLTLAANQLTVGRTIRLTARGLKSTAAVPGTLTLAAKFGATTLTTTGAQTPEASLTDNVWEAQLLITCRTTGASGSVFVQGFYRTTAGAGVGNAVQWEMGSTSSVTIDTTASHVIDLTGDWSVADIANDLRGTNVLVEQLG